MPKVSCICPTANRPGLVKSAIRLFLEQSYTNSELIILDDGTETIEVPLGSRVRYVWEPRSRSLGEKHNRLMCLAGGDIILHWSDDDWYAPWRIAYQVGLVETLGVDMVSPSRIMWIDAKDKQAWDFNPGGKYLSGASLAYRRGVWDKCPYEDVATGEDAGFIQNSLRHGATAADCDYRLCVQRLHASNTAMNRQMNDHWETSFEEAVKIVGRDYDTYFGGPDGMPR